VKAGIARITLLGDPEKIAETAGALGVDLSGASILNPASSDKAEPYAEALYMLRKDKGMTAEEAAKKLADPMYYGVMMVKMGDAEGLVSGAIHSTGDMLRPALPDHQVEARHQDRILLLPDECPTEPTAKTA
jgi:phosphate acetyltransferase